MTNINAGMMRNAIKSAIKNLDVNKEMVNSLNVFPVPDGVRRREGLVVWCVPCRLRVLQRGL